LENPTKKLKDESGKSVFLGRRRAVFIIVLVDVQFERSPNQVKRAACEEEEVTTAQLRLPIRFTSVSDAINNYALVGIVDSIKHAIVANSAR
jgi:hypothetical protein